MQRDEALARLRAMGEWLGMDGVPREDTQAARWALDRIAYLEDIPRQIVGLAQCAESSGATERATLLLKLAAAEQRITELESERDEARRNHIRVQEYLDQRVTKEQAYDEHIAPLMAQIIAHCKEHQINTHATFYLDDRLACTTHLLLDGDPIEMEMLRLSALAYGNLDSMFIALSRACHAGRFNGEESLVMRMLDK